MTVVPILKRAAAQREFESFLNINERLKARIFLISFDKNDKFFSALPFRFDIEIDFRLNGAA